MTPGVTSSTPPLHGVATATGGLRAPAAALRAAERPSTLAPLLTLAGVSKHFRTGPPWRRRTVDVLRDLSLQVFAGELVGLVGENGSGKSTLMQLIVGLQGKDSGTIDRPARFGYCPQQPLVWQKLTVAEHFALFATAYRMDESRGRAAARRLLDELEFARYADYRVEQLSGGTRQKLNLALALMHDPQLLLLDEPYSGFDWETYLKFWTMTTARRDSGMGIMIVSHLLAERDRLDRIYVLRDGQASST